MMMSLFAVGAGFILLVWGAERFVLGASATARSFGVSPLIIGLTIVGFGTSAPEMLVSGIASWEGNPGLAVGNALGSNITNIALVLGLAALIKPLTVHSQILRRELPVLLLIMVLALVLLIDGELSRGDGLLLLLGMGGMIYWLVMLGLRSRTETEPMTAEYDAEMPKPMPVATALMWLVLGMVVLFVGSQILVHGAVDIAREMGVSDLVIGLTIIAIGTSLPELAATIMSVLRNEHDIAIGNVIGSNMFNLLGVLALPGILAPGPIDSDVLTRDYPLMIALTLALFVMAYGFRGGHGRINRWEAALLLGVYIGYMYVLYRMSI